VSSHLRVSQVLEILDSLQTTVRDFAERESKLQQDFRSRAAFVERQFDEASAEINARRQAELEQIAAYSRSAADVIEATIARRKESIARALKNCLRNVAAAIDAQEGQRKYEIQKKTLETERQHKESLAQNEAAHEQYQQSLAELRAFFVKLEETARQAFRGYPKLQAKLSAPGEPPTPDLSLDEYKLYEALHALCIQTQNGLKRFGRFPLPLLFRFIPAWLLGILLVAGHAGAWLLRSHLGLEWLTLPAAAGSAAGSLALLVAVYYLGQRHAEPLAATLANALEEARRLHNLCLAKSDERYHREIERIENEYTTTNQQLKQQWELTLDEVGSLRISWPKQMEAKAARIRERLEARRRRSLDQLEQEKRQAEDAVNSQADAEIQKLAAERDEKLAKINLEAGKQWDIMEKEWNDAVRPRLEVLLAAEKEARQQFPSWDKICENWTPPKEFSHVVPFGRLEVSLAGLCDILPSNPRLALPNPPQFDTPLTLHFPHEGCLLFETNQTASDSVAPALNNIILRLLSLAPPGRVAFTIIDPVNLGQNFAGIMHLSDYAEYLISSRIWTQASQFEQRLAELNEHMEKVIQMYLRNEYETIVEYNKQAGNIAEKYHFLVIADFPANFSDTAVRRLLNITASGAKCGVYTFIHWDRRRMLPPDLPPEELRKNSITITGERKQLRIAGAPLKGLQLTLDAPPPPELESSFLHTVGQASVDSNRVEVPFAHVAPEEPELWSGDTTEELRVPIGRTGATKFQYLAIGKGTRQHGLIAGKTGSGKSTLFHVIITNLALWFSPEQVEFYLVDFKKGVEFKCYATHRLPHARVIAIESDREFGLSVLQRIDAELRRRGDLFRRLGVQDLAGYKRAGGTEPMPRSLLLIDEFQEFFTEDDQISQSAAVLLDRIVRQGRAFGIHVLLGSQTLGGAYTLARATIGQMVIRIALQCNEADAYLIMDDNNPAPRLLSRPGEAIYNDSAGMLEGNSPFQVVWLSDEERDEALKRIQKVASRKPGGYPAPIVFEGNVPADIRDNPELEKLLRNPPAVPTAVPRVWLGAPVSIKGPTEAAFQQLSGNHLLVVGQRDEAILAMLGISLVSLAAQFPKGTARFVLLDSSPPGSPPREFLDRLVASIPHEIIQAKAGDMAVLATLADELRQLAAESVHSATPPTFLFIHQLQNYRKLRRDDDLMFSTEADTSSPAAQLNEIITEGAHLGFHLIATCDTYNNVNRFLSRKALSEFEMRVLFQMSANDSASLCDSPKASTLGLNRALFYNEQEGYLEMFRPYALPTNDWLETVKACLSARE